MWKYKKPILSALTGITLGYLCSQTWIAHSWLILIIWGLVGLIFGYLIKSIKETFVNGAIFGSLLTSTYAVFVFKDRNLLLSAAIAIIGGTLGVIIFAFGNWVRNNFAPEKKYKD